MRRLLPGERRYYLAGPMTGLPNFGYDLFEDAAVHLRSLKLDIASPHDRFKHESEELRASRSPSFYMAHAIALLSSCTDIVLLPGWSRSRGARTELGVAVDCGYGVHYYNPGKKPSLLEIV